MKEGLVTTKPELPVIPFANRDNWAAWLEQHHATSNGIRLKLAKKGTHIASISQEEAVEIALCFGWIDSQADRFNDDHWLLRFTPRRPKSKWSQINRARAESLLQNGDMRPAGLREVQRAKADGRWDAAYEAPSTATVPEDLRHELDRNEGARAYFDSLDSRNRYAILYQIQDARKPETRARRIAKYVNLLREQKTQ